MIKKVSLKIHPDRIHDTSYIVSRAAKAMGVDESEVTGCVIVKKSIDARKKPVFVLSCQVYINEPVPKAAPVLSLGVVNDRPRVVIVGAGPAGYFAALKLIELGLRPIVLDRGKDVRTRRRDLRAIQQFGEVNPDSNYCFGEGGAGTYSDGKLYTRAKKRGDYERILHILVEHGAKSDILIDAHPHIGSNKLPGIITNIRLTIEQYGGEVHFNARVTDIIVRNGQCTGCITSDGQTFEGRALILATGHSARDMYTMLHDKGIAIEAKPFALGVRVEHPQPLIDKIQYGQEKRHENLPASAYRLTCQVGDTSVYSFCMCPGGLIVPTATTPGEIVINGMSLSRRDSPFANSGIVTPVSLEYLKHLGYKGVFAAMDYQRDVEQALFDHGDGSQKAPAQRLTDFLRGNLSSSLNDTSYIPGVYAAPLHEWLPTDVVRALQTGFLSFGRRLKGYVTSEANVLAVESRTSAPVRIPRHHETLMHEQVSGLFPAGEGAGYAGGILSAAMDGERVALAVKIYLS